MHNPPKKTKFAKEEQVVSIPKQKHNENKDPLTWIGEKWLEFLHN